MSRFPINRVPYILVGVVMLSAGAITVGRRSGHGLAEQLRPRLELRWPALMSLPEGQRAAIVRDAIACDLLRQSAPTAGSVEACVREGAGKIGQHVPGLPGVDL